MHNSTRVISAWDGDKLVGLVRALDDGETVAFLHDLLVDPAYQGQYIGDELMKRIMRFYQNLLYVKVMPSDPKTIPFYERYGFQQYDNYSAMVRKHFLGVGMMDRFAASKETVRSTEHGCKLYQ